MSDGKPRQPAEPMYLMLRASRVEDFNRLRKAGQTSDFRGCDFRGIDLRGLDLRTCRLQGASLHAAHISGAFFPVELAPDEIDLSVRLGTRMRYR